jgi:four helix bundle protein
VTNDEKRLIKTFQDLDAWKQAHALRLSVFHMLTELKPEHKYGLSQQIQRSAISIGSNIAEGFGRSSLKEKIQFYRIAYGSLNELQDQLIVCRDLNLVSYQTWEAIDDQAERVIQVLNGLIRSTKRLLDLRRSTERHSK